MYSRQGEAKKQLVGQAMLPAGRLKVRGRGGCESRADIRYHFYGEQ